MPAEAHQIRAMIEGQHASNRARARVIPQRLDKRWHASRFDKRIIIQQQKQITTRGRASRR
jgi:hypothetical protein